MQAFLDWCRRVGDKLEKWAEYCAAVLEEDEKERDAMFERLTKE